MSQPATKKQKHNESTFSILLVCPSLEHIAVVELKKKYPEIMKSIMFLTEAHSFNNDINFPNRDIKGLAVCGIKDSVLIDALLQTHVPNVSWVHTFSTGANGILTKCIKSAPNRFQVTNARGAFSESLAEYVLFGAMYFAKKFSVGLEQYNRAMWKKYTPLVLRGATMGIIGYGNIGESVARLAKNGFGMRILAVKRDPSKITSSAKSLVDEVYKTEDVEKVLAQCDYVVSILPGAPGTKHFFNKKKFATMRSGSVFISIGRGTVVDECALLEELKQNRIKAVLDVCEEEPLPKSSPLWKVGHEKLLLSPHCADWNPEHYIWSCEVFAKNVRRFLNGNAFEYTVNINLGY